MTEEEKINKTVLSRLPITFGKHPPLLPIGYYANVIKVSDDIGIAISTDGIGSKIKVVAEREYGNISNYFKLGWDLVAANVNDIICVGAKPTAFVDYVSMKYLDTINFQSLIDGMKEAAIQSGVAIVGGETAILDYTEWPELVGTAIGTVRPDSVLDGSAIEEDDRILGFPSNGLHCNGYSIARRALDNKDIPVDPTEIYVRPIRELVESVELKAINHITGGGFNNLLRNNSTCGYLLNNLPEPPEIFTTIRDNLNLTKDYMYSQFNMGVGMVVIADGANADIAMRLEPDLQVIGRVVPERCLSIR